jgi:hypothetical protein
MRLGDLPGVANSSNGNTVLGVRQLGDQARSSGGGKCQSKTEDEPADDEHGQVDTLALQNSTDDHDNAANGDSPAAAVAISDPRGDRGREDAAKGHGSAHDSQDGATGPSEELVPLAYSLESSKEGAVVARGRVGAHGAGEEEEVEVPAGGGAVPGRRVLGEAVDALGLVNLLGPAGKDIVLGISAAFLALATSFLVLARCRETLTEGVKKDDHIDLLERRMDEKGAGEEE